MGGGGLVREIKFSIGKYPLSLYWAIYGKYRQRSGSCVKWLLAGDNSRAQCKCRRVEERIAQ